MNLSNYKPAFLKSSQHHKQSLNGHADHQLNHSQVKFKKEKRKIPKSINNTFDKIQKSTKKPNEHELNSILKTEFIPTSIKKLSLHNSKRAKGQNTCKKTHNSSISNSKKHTISVFQFDNHNKQAINYAKQLDSKVKSVHTTKRKPSSNQKNSSSLTTVNIRQKINHFKILSNCLKQYIKTQKKQNDFVNPNEIIKMVKAFNKTQISGMSRPLELLISQMICVIQDCFSQSNKQIHQKYKTPVKERLFQNKLGKTEEGSSKKNREYQKMYTEQWEPQKQIQKKLISEYNQINQERLSFQQSRWQDIQIDFSKKQENLQILKYESNRLKKFVQSQSRKDKSQKQKELQELKRILNEQQSILSQLEDKKYKNGQYNEQLQEDQQSDDSSLKYFPDEN